MQILFDFVADHLRFIIVFDELDKIEPESKNLETEDKVNNIPEFELSVSGFSEGARTRSRKQNILRTLANMKYFLSSAQAKFIFIAGRELFDAFLADMSDREFSISSVFNGVINVNSFLKSASSQKDISFMTEQYICQRLFPASYVPRDSQGQEDYTLQHYQQFIIEKTERRYKEKPALLQRHREELTRQIFFLYQFSLYLAHIGNGSPKKIALYFEKYVRSEDRTCCFLWRKKSVLSFF